jgi:hypothetical protein
MTNEIIISKLDKFIKKYYKNRLIKGILYGIFLIFSFFLILNTLEYFGYYSTLTRSILFYLFLIIAILILYFFICIPLLKIFRLTKTISHKEAANIIGKHFPEVSDKLLNLLQLQEQATEQDSELLEASISQRTKELTPIPFVKAIDISKNKRYVKWTIIPVLIILVCGIFFPSFISEPTYRYINHSKHFQKPAPFSYKLLNNKLQVLQHEDIDIRVKIEGQMLVDNVNIVINKQVFQMKKEKKDVFSHSIKQLQNTTSFHFESSEITSNDYKIEVLPKPILLDLQAIITYPTYTQIEQQSYTNVSNFSVPKGSTITWKAATRDTKAFLFNYNNKQESFSPDKNGRLSFSKRILSDLSYNIYTKNDYTTFSDSLQFFISAIADLSPQIAVIEQKDSLLIDRVYFRGQIKDDYGFSKLEFIIEKYEQDAPNEAIITKHSLPLNSKEKAQEYYYAYDLTQLNLNPGDRVVYYFEVWDNDGIDGAKSTRSNAFAVEIPTMQEIDKKQEKTSSEIKKETEESLKQLKKIQQEISELNKKMLEKKELDWQDKKQIEALKHKQDQIKQALEQISQKIKENNQLDQRYNKSQTEEIINKQKELERLYQEVAKDMFEELNKLMKENINKEDLKQALEKIKLNSEDIEKQLDRNLEMYKRLEVDKKMQEAIDKLNKTAQEQKELAKKTEQNPKDNKPLQDKQSELNKSFEEIKKDLKELQQKGLELEEKMEIKRDKAKEDSITQEQNQAQQKMENRKNKDASKNQNKAAEKMQEMADNLQQQQQQQEQEQLAEDIEQVRQILKNLVKLSFMQEDLILKVRETSVTDPLYQNLINSQNKIKNDMKMISDSLFAMSKRQPQISNIINKELTSIDNQIGSSIEKLLQYNQGIYGSYKNTQATTPQQYTMTSMNNLSLLLAESLDNMQQNMKSMSEKSSSCKSNPQNQCNSPKSGKKNPKTMRELQQALNKEMERLKRELDAQKQKGETGKPKIGENAKINEELARMAAQQEIIRKMMQQYSNELKAEEGKSAGEIDNLIKQMEQTETDIVNKIINQQTINRQNNILTRMLQHEKAQQKQEQEQRRESTEGKDLIENSNNQFLEFDKLKNRELELFKQVPPVFSPYYKEKVNDFFINLNVEQ